MLGLLYLIICFVTGYAVLIYVSPNIFRKDKYNFEKKRYRVSPFFLWLPAIGITGIILVTWLVYILACIFQNSRKPLGLANAVALFIIFNVDYFLLFFKAKKKALYLPKIINRNLKNVITELIYIIFFLTISTWLMYYVFHVKDGNLMIGVTVCSDFAPHTAMIRSFSYGNNFPTMYPYYTGSDVKYHFMFQFLVGNLEFLGMRIDHAFNIPSIIGMSFVYMLLYVLANKISGKVSSGIIAALLFTFRSSSSLFLFLKDVPKGESAISALLDNTEFLGYSSNENWGLWNLNVYANQRHLALCLALMLFVIIMVMPYLYRGFFGINRIRNNSEKAPGIRDYFVEIFLTKDGWMPYDIKLAVFLGILAGASAFFNGAVLIGLLMILFFMAVLSKNRLNYVIIAAISLLLSMIQSKVFMEESSISPKFYFGFIAENRTFFGSLDYIFRLTGILFLVILLAFMFFYGVRRYLILVFCVPFIFSFFVSLTIDVTVNHKYIMMSVMLLDIMVAAYLSQMLEKRDILRRVGIVLIIILLTSTGIYDTYSIFVRNGEGKEIPYALDDEIIEWVRNNSDSKDVFLTGMYSVSKVTLGGGMLYYGWPYYAWSAGYDTDYRQEQTAKMYSANNPETLDRLVKENNIRFIVVDLNVRENEEYHVNEENIANTYQEVFTSDYDMWKFTIYDTKLRK